jgi:hypothetical protein
LFQTGRSQCERDDEQKNTRDNDAEEISIHIPQADRVVFVPLCLMNRRPYATST